MVQPSSVDVRLDRFFRVFENHRYPHIDPAADQPDLTRQVEPDGAEPFILHPGEFVLGSTYEVVTLPDDVAARLEGKSSLGRLGLLTHSTAGFIDPGFSGHVTLELSNVATLPIKLWPGMKIGQLCFFRLSSPSEHPYGSEKYGSRYQRQRGPTPSRSHLDFHRTQICLSATQRHPGPKPERKPLRGRCSVSACGTGSCRGGGVGSGRWGRGRGGGGGGRGVARCPRWYRRLGTRGCRGGPRTRRAAGRSLRWCSRCRAGPWRCVEWGCAVWSGGRRRGVARRCRGRRGSAPLVQ